MAAKSPTIPDIILEQYALEELGPEEMKRIDDQILEDPELGARLERLYESNESILEKNSPTDFATGVKKRLAAAEGKAAKAGAESGRARNKESRNPLRIFILAPAMAAAAVLLLLIVQPGLFSGDESSLLSGTSEQTKNEYIGLKGDQEPLLRVYRQIGHNAELIDKDSTVKNHDILQIAYCASGETYGVIFSIDGRGVVTLHFPERSDGEALLNQAGEIPIPHAYEIDDAPDFERFFLVSSRTDINVAEVLAAGYELAGRPDAACDQRLELTDQYRQTSLIIRKENEQ